LVNMLCIQDGLSMANKIEPPWSSKKYNSNGGNRDDAKR
jgi:hypothetical protein